MRFLKDLYLKRLRLLLVGMLMISGFAVVGISYWFSRHYEKNFLGDLLLNLGPEIFGMAATVGSVDYLIERRDNPTTFARINPMARTLLASFDELRMAYDKYLVNLNIRNRCNRTLSRRSERN